MSDKLRQTHGHNCHSCGLVLSDAEKDRRTDICFRCTEAMDRQRNTRHTQNCHVPAWFLVTPSGQQVSVDPRPIPHDCSDPKCPGNVNRRKLAALDGLMAAMGKIAKAVRGARDTPTSNQEAWDLLMDIGRHAGAALAEAEKVS